MGFPPAYALVLLGISITLCFWNDNWVNYKRVTDYME